MLSSYVKVHNVDQEAFKIFSVVGLPYLWDRCYILQPLMRIIDENYYS
jgi:hypothetical protein